MQVSVITRRSPDWGPAKDHIRAVYRDAYDANVDEFAPRLVVAKNDNGEVLGTAGLRTLETGFFSAAYMDGGVGETLSAAFGHPVNATLVIEAVSLSVSRPCAALPMINAIILEGRRMNARYGLFTATDRLRKMLERAGLPLHVICPAQISAVASPENWGSYYDTTPMVCAFIETPENPIVLAPQPCSAEQRVRLMIEGVEA